MGTRDRLRARRAFAQLVRQRREQLGLTAGDIGRRLGRDHSTVSRAERAERGISVEDIPLWAQALELDAGDLCLAFVHRAGVPRRREKAFAPKKVTSAAAA